MKIITYNNKQYKLPFDVELPEDPTAEVEVANRFSGQKTTMPEFAAAVYDTIIGSEMFGDYDTVRKGLDWFKQHFAAQYMVVLASPTFLPWPVGPGVPNQSQTSLIASTHPPFLYNRGPTTLGWIA